RQGAQVYVGTGGRAELQFDDGSRLRLDANAMVTLQTLYSDKNGEFTEITQTEGPAEYRLMHERGVYQVNTPTVALDAAGPARFRINAADRTQICMYQGRGSIEGPPGKTTLIAGNCLDMANANSPYHTVALPPQDNFGKWC